MSIIDPKSPVRVRNPEPCRCGRPAVYLATWGVGADGAVLAYCPACEYAPCDTCDCAAPAADAPAPTTDEE